MLILGYVTVFAGSYGVAGSIDGVRTGSRFSFPRTLSFDSVGNLYVTDYNNGRLRMISTLGNALIVRFPLNNNVWLFTGTVTTIASFTALMTAFVSSTGSIYIAGARQIVNVSSNGS
jgi:hypothetical protein